MVDFASPDSFDIHPRTRLVFGRQTLNQLGALARSLHCRHALIVTDPGIVAVGHADRAAAQLRAAGLSVSLFGSVRENPTTLDVDRCLEVARSHQIDLFVGLGGGSSMDTAKGANFLLTNGGVMRDYWGVGKATRPMRPLIAIPTTAGTGSECQSAALIADELTHQKMACLDPKAAAAIALLDPELTLSQPVRVTTVTGVDAVAHALETAVTRKRNPYSQVFSREAFRLTARALPKVVAQPDNIEARADMLLGAAYAGLAIESSMLGAAHAAANPLTAHHGVVHGEAVGLMLPLVVQWNATDPDCAAIYAEWARAAGWAGSHTRQEAACRLLVDQLNMLLDTVGIATDLKAAGVSDWQDKSLDTLAGEAAKQWTATFNPVAVPMEAFLQLYQAALRGRSKAPAFQSFVPQPEVSVVGG